MNYDKMLTYHKEKKADATIAVLEVPLKEASRFGIMNCDAQDTIVEFEEKPAHPKNNLASMGIYIFSYKALRKALIADAPDDKYTEDRFYPFDPYALQMQSSLQVLSVWCIA